jgi:hypothetical protein
MASVMDFGILKNFTNLFVYLFILIMVYAVLESTNLLKNRALHAIIAFLITVIVAVTGGGLDIITSMAPWAVVIGVFLFFMLLLGQFAGIEQSQVLRILGNKPAWYIFIPLIIILIVAWTGGASAHSKTVVNDQGETVTVEVPQREFMTVLTNPKVLGLIVVMLVAALTLVLMSGGGGAVKI